MRPVRMAAAVVVLIAAVCVMGRALTPQAQTPRPARSVVTWPANPANTNINGGPTERCYGNAVYLGTSSQYPTGECGAYQP